MTAVVLGTHAAAVTGNSLTAKTGSFTVNVGDNAALVGVVTQHAASAMAAHWDSTGTNQPMTLIGSKSDASNILTVWLFAILNPTTGTHTLNMTWTGTSDIAVSLISFQNVDTSSLANAFKNVTLSAASTLAQAVSQASATGDYAVCVWSGDGSLGTPTPNSWYVTNVPNNLSAAAAYATGSTTVSFGCAGPTLPWAAVSCDVAQASVANDHTRSSMMMAA